jgi:hypothetical protein
MNLGVSMEARETKPFYILWQETLNMLSKIDCQYIPLCPSLAQMEGKANMKLEATCYSLGKNQVAEMRMVKITSPKIDILNTMIFPKTPNTLPVFACELISLIKEYVVFLDIQTPGFDIPSAVLTESIQSVRTKYAHLPTQVSPEWAREHSTGGYIFSRFEKPQHLSQFRQAYHDYFHQWHLLLQNTDDPSQTPKKESLAELYKYQQHHVTHSPGNRFLSSIFGKENSENFLHNFMYSHDWIVSKFG